MVLNHDYNGNSSCDSASATEAFYRSKAVPIDMAEGYIVLAEVELQIETEVFQVKLESKTLNIHRLRLKYTLNTTDQFSIQTSQGRISSSLTEMP